MAVIFDEEKINDRIRHWRSLLKTARASGSTDDIYLCSVYIDSLQDVRRMHGLPKLTGD
jgi:hypothetical protein